MISQLELASELLRESGITDAWYNGCDTICKSITKNGNGHLFEQLLRASNYDDIACVELLRNGGAPLLHVLHLFA